MLPCPDYAVDATVVIVFNTFTSDDPSASVTITNLVAGDIEIHKDGGTTQRASDNGVTVNIDFDSVTGGHLVTIALSDNSHAGFYVAGSRYQVRMEGTTVDGATLNCWIGCFSIGCILRPTVAGRTADIQATGEMDANLTMMGGVAQSATDLKDFADAGYDPATNKVQGVVLCDTVTTLTGHTAQTGDSFARLGAPAGASVSVDIAAIKAETVLIVADTNELQTDDVPGLIAGLNDPTAGAIADAVLDEPASEHQTQGSVGRTLGDQGANEDSLYSMVYARLDANVSSRATAAALATVDTVVDGIASEIGTAGDGLTELASEATARAILTDTGTDGVVLAATEDVYHADIQLTVDGTNSKDEYTVVWFKNGVRVTSGITVPKIQVVKRADGTDLVAQTAMTQIGATGGYKYDESTNRITAGEAVVAVVTATIDASGRSFAKVLTRDSSA